jgi:virginiamycin B lyase
MNRGAIGRVDPQTFTLTEYAAPTTAGDPASLYDVKVSAQGIVWVTSSGANRLFRFDPKANRWDQFPLPQAESVPYGLTLTPDGHVWFTEAAIAANRIGEYAGG